MVVRLAFNFLSTSYLSAGSASTMQFIRTPLTCGDLPAIVVYMLEMPSNGMQFVYYPMAQGVKTTVHRLVESGSQCENYTNLGATFNGTHAL